jgi:glycosyltransferase involved in cell wall biosynthesis
MLLDEELRARMIRRGREQAARFSWNWTARQVLEIYQDVIGQSRA